MEDRMNRNRAVSVFLLAVFGGLSFVNSAFAQAPEKKNVGMAVDWNTKRVAFEMSGKPWAQVFEWFADQTGMPFRSHYAPPKGTFNFIPPKDPKTGKPREYTLTEVYDTINEFLQSQHRFTLLRLDSTLTMVPADGRPPSLIRRVTLDQLKNCAPTEIVEIISDPLRGGLDAEKIAPEAKRVLGAFGQVTPLAVSNQLIMQADAKSLRLVLAILQRSEDPTPAAAPPASQSPPAAACCGSAPRYRAGLLARLLRR
jgi:hypothetical protein